LPGILAGPSDALSPRMVRIIENLAGVWHRLDERIEGLSNEIEAIARRDSSCERLMSVPGIGPIISSVMVATIGAGDVFSNGRDFTAWLGLVPKQISTGDRTILGKISKRGNRYLRVLFAQAAWVVLMKPKSGERYGLKSWIEAAKKRVHGNVLNAFVPVLWCEYRYSRNGQKRASRFEARILCNWTCSARPDSFVGVMLIRRHQSSGSTKESYGNRHGSKAPSRPRSTVRPRRAHRVPVAQQSVPVVNQIRIYWWCSPPRTGRQRMCPVRSTARGTVVSFSKDRCVRTSL
jgi:Transposase IS116/IS110/IS902 family